MLQSRRRIRYQRCGREKLHLSTPCHQYNQIRRSVFLVVSLDILRRTAQKKRITRVICNVSDVQDLDTTRLSAQLQWMKAVTQSKRRKRSSAEEGDEAVELEELVQ